MGSAASDMNEADLLNPCIELASTQPQELFLRGYFKVDMNTQNFNAITEFICRMAIH